MITVIFKPSKSGLTQDLLKIKYYEYTLKEFMVLGRKDIRQKSIITKVSYDDLLDVYNYVLENTTKEHKVLIMLSIANLFE